VQFIREVKHIFLMDGCICQEACPQGAIRVAIARDDYPEISIQRLSEAVDVG